MNNQHKWFKPVRGSYIPISTFGWLTYVPFVGYLVFVAKITVDQTHNVSYRLITIFGQWVIASLVMTVVAKRFS